MSARNQTIDYIKKSLQDLPYDNYGVVHEEDLFKHVPGWESLPTPS